MNEWFRKFAQKTSAVVGSPFTFALAFLSIILWMMVGPHFHYSDTWQLVINTSTTIITFLMVFLIQNTQNRDARAIHLKLDELIRSHKHARNNLIDIEQLSDSELDVLHSDLCEMKNKAESKLEEILTTRQKTQHKKIKKA